MWLKAIALGMLAIQLYRQEEGASSILPNGTVLTYTYICLQPCPCWHGPHLRMFRPSNMSLQSTALSARPI